MNIILVAGTFAASPYYGDDGGLRFALFFACAGAVLLGVGALLVKRHAPRSCPARRHDYAGRH